VVADYVALTKPKVQSLLLLTTVAAMEIAGDPSLGLLAATIAGGYMSAGGAGAINHWFDRDIDAAMERTADRPIPSGRVSARAALTFGVTLEVAALTRDASTSPGPAAARPGGGCPSSAPPSGCAARCRSC
jgi:protoheme IX farnesyltransferase